MNNGANQILIILIFYFTILIGFSQGIAADSSLKNIRPLPYIDAEYLGVEVNFIKQFSKRFYLNSGLGGLASKMGHNTEFLKGKVCLGYKLNSVLHLYVGVKTGFNYFQSEDLYYHFLGNESGLFWDVGEVEFGFKGSIGFNVNNFTSGLKSGINVLVIRIPLAKNRI